MQHVTPVQGENTKQEYVTPELKKLGKVVELTKGGSGPDDDGGELAFP